MRTIGLWLLMILKMSVFSSIVLIKSEIYLPFTAKVSPDNSSALPSIIAGISVLPEEIMTFEVSVLI